MSNTRTTPVPQEKTGRHHRNDAAWFPLYQPAGRAALRVFCLPYAGGSASLFRDWPKALPSDVEVLALQLPGRGGRLFEKPFTRAEDVVAVLVETVLPLLDLPFALFGHSLGALLAFEVARHLQLHFRRVPKKLFVAACQAPQEMRSRRERYQLSDAGFVDELKRLNGTPPEILENRSMLKCFLPALRADFQIVDDYVHQPGPQLQCGIHVMGGTEDRISIQQLRQWSAQTATSFSLDMIAGDHFFIKQSSAYLLQRMHQELSALVQALGTNERATETSAPGATSTHR